MEKERLKLKEKRQEFTKDKVSIVTPVFNGETHLPSMLESVLGQTYLHIEMILVDDGSTDDTVKIAESYRERFKARGYEYYIIQTEHKNASAAINQGLPYVTGEYLIWPDSDDKLERESIEKRVGFLQSHPQYQCVRTLPYYFEEGTERFVEADEKMGDLRNEDLFWDILEFKTYVCCGCYMLKTKCFFEIYPERHIPEYDVGQNFQMLLPYMYYYKCPTILDRLYGVCVRKGSHSRIKMTRKEEEIKYRKYENLVDEIVKICGINDKKSKERIAYWKTRRRYLIAMKYRNKKQIIRSCCKLCVHGKWNAFKFIKDGLWFSLENTWVVKKAYPLYRKQCNKCRQLFRQLYGLKEVNAIKCKKKFVSITFNDGYIYTNDILEKLDKYDVKATFFLTGDWIKAHPDDCKRIFEAGHDIENHSYSHLDMTKLTSIEVNEEINQVQCLLEEYIGRKNKLFRFPYGSSNRGVVRFVLEQGLIPVRWSINSRDQSNIKAEQICDNIIKNKNLKSGAIILMHASCAHTVEALDLIIPVLKKKGYQLVTISDLFKEASILDINKRLFKEEIV